MMSDESTYPVVLGSTRQQLRDVLNALGLLRQRDDILGHYDERNDRATYRGIDLYYKAGGQWAIILAETKYSRTAEVERLLRQQHVQGVRVLSFDDFSIDRSWD